ncbi:MAG: hypothetical protein ACP5U2_07435 [Bryobacteraceae bacterium]
MSIIISWNRGQRLRGRYNREVNWARAFLTVGLLLAASCSRNPQSVEAVRQGILDHLASRPDLDLKGIQVEVTSVAIRQNEADAVVNFRPRRGEGEAFQMRYTLERKGGRWVVKSKAEAGGAPHGRGAALPPGHPQLGAPTQGGGEAPAR